MKRIGIITYHRATNYGAVLQAYSFLNKLRKDFGNNAEIEIIDYSTLAASKDHFRTVASTFVHDGIKQGITEYKKNARFNLFSNSLKMSNKRIVSDRIKRISNYMNERYDIVISGSDAVFSWNGKRFPSIYLLGEESKFKKISYAASAHRLAYKEEPNSHIHYCKEAFESFDYLGVRDKETERFVHFCSPQLHVNHNCDPSFLIDLNSIKNKIDLSRYKLSKKPLILVMTPNEAIGKEVVEKFEGKFSVVSLFISNPAIKNHFGILSPFEWASIFSCAVLTITEYFHASIFSLLNSTPVVSIDSSKRSQGYEGKIHDLMWERLSLRDMYINYDDIEQQGINVISKKAMSLLEKDCDLRIKKAVEKEKRYYDSFRNFLNELLK